jgi:ribose transport system ATP-binding protein
MRTFLDATSITKSFSGAPALSDGRISVDRGEIHALMGANGAGKSTLLKILTGVYTKDAGQIKVANDDGNLVEAVMHGPRDADRLGIAIVHQELILSENLTIADNISLGSEPMTFGGIMVNKHAAVGEAKRALALVGADLDPLAMVSSLSTAEKQLVEIAKSLSRNAQLLILDEPTTSLTDHESRKLFEVLQALRDRSIAIVYVSHRMDEIFSICDRITVMRDGAFVDTVATSDIDRRDLIRLMIGRNLTREYGEVNTSTRQPGEPVLSISDVSTPGLLRGVSLQVGRGEIVGMFGLIGAGRTEVARAAFGLDRVSTGRIAIQNRRMSRVTPQRAIAAGLGVVPEDRKDCGLVLGLSISDNLDLAAQRRWPAIQWSGIRSKRLWAEFSARLGIVARDRHQAVGTLSGGNQQKVVLAKWLALKPAALILDEPTRGVDVGAKEDIYTVIRELADAGTGILVISSEIEEVLMISDRIIVMREGAITFDAPNRNLDSHVLLSAAMGEPA